MEFVDGQAGRAIYFLATYFLVTYYGRQTHPAGRCRKGGRQGRRQHVLGEGRREEGGAAGEFLRKMRDMDRVPAYIDTAESYERVACEMVGGRQWWCVRWKQRSMMFP